MAFDVAGLENPVDVMYLIHRALRRQAKRAQQLADGLETGGSLQPFKLAFNDWAAALLFHSDREEAFMPAPLSETSPEPGGDIPEKADQVLADMVKWAMAANEDQLHREMLEKLEEVLAVLEDDIGTTSVITRTKQHLRRQVTELRIIQEDHLETEEALVLPVMRQTMDKTRQLAFVRGLLIDDEAQDPRWVIDWLIGQLDAEDRNTLALLEGWFQAGTRKHPLGKRQLQSDPV